MLPNGFILDTHGHLKYYNRLIGNVQDNLIHWTNETIRHFEYTMLKQQLEKSGYTVKWES
jgi:hypothetical protein